ncbi:MAG TPA: zf-HC2 domain-containing protein [Candidatus Deferrimicrobium sp.]|nr:zf-HC2 domain-containing protein [Candidatus Deferrimicrobium sp.]
MSLDQHCRRIQEQFPLLFNSSLSKQEIAEVHEHLNQCPACKSIFDKERVLYRIAVGTQARLLEDHPAADLLSLYVQAPEQLTEAQTTELATHVSQCELCQKVVAKIRHLPETLTDIATAEEIPFISELDSISSAERPTSKIIDAKRRQLWRWTAAAALAAALALTAIPLLMTDQDVSTAKVEARFGAVVRSIGQDLVFESDDSSFDFHAIVYVGPEEGHNYALSVTWPDRDTVLYHIDALSGFDNEGYAHCEFPLWIGIYEITLLDVEAEDTLLTRWPFEVRLKP